MHGPGQIQRGDPGGQESPLKNHKNIGFLSKIGPDCPTKPANDGPLVLRLPHYLKKKCCRSCGVGPPLAELSLLDPRMECSTLDQVVPGSFTDIQKITFKFTHLDYT